MKIKGKPYRIVGGELIYDMSKTEWEEDELIPVYYVTPGDDRREELLRELAELDGGETVVY